MLNYIYKTITKFFTATKKNVWSHKVKHLLVACYKI